MPEDAPRPAQTAIRTDLGAIFVSLELSRRAWLVTSLSPGGGEKMSKHSVQAGDIAGLLRRFAQLKSASADGTRLPCHHNPRGRPGRLLDPSRAAERRDRKPRCRSGLDCHFAPAAAGEDRPD